MWNHSNLRTYIVEHFLRETDKECCNLCVNPKEDKPTDSKRHQKILQKKADKSTDVTTKQKLPPSCLRLTKKEDVLNFKLENFDEELLQRAPLMRSVLMAMSLRHSKMKGHDLLLTPAVCMAAAVCLKNRSKMMTAIQLIISVIVQHSGMMVIVTSILYLIVPYLF